MSNITTARVTVTIDMAVGDTWGPECNLAQVRDQATETALGRLNRALDGRDWQIVGKPIVKAIMTEMKS